MIRFRQTLSALAVMCSGLATSCALPTNDADNRSDEGLPTRDVRGAGLVQSLKCRRLVQTVAQLDLGPSGVEEVESWDCQLLPQDAGGQTDAWLTLEGPLPELFATHGAELASGVQTILVSGALARENDLQIRDTSSVELIPVTDGLGADKQIQALAVAKVLVVRVIASDAQPVLSADELSRRVFGGYDDNVNLVSQMNACSYGKKQFVPVSATGVVNGVLEISIPQAVTGQKLSVIRDATYAEVRRRLGSVTPYDHIMYNYPGGTTIGGKGWIANGTSGGNTSSYNDRIILDVGTQMHEIGHNLGLGHAGYGSSVYGDTMGYMGGGGRAQSEGPLMCFNAPMSAKLGWYSDRTHVFDAQTASSWAGDLIGVADYGASRAGDVVVLQIPRPRTGAPSIFMTYNRQKGINIGTGLFRNQVAIVESSNPSGQSWAIAGLNAGQSHVYENFDGTGGTLSISVDSVQMQPSGAVDRARVRITVTGIASPQ